MNHRKSAVMVACSQNACFEEVTTPYLGGLLAVAATANG